MPLLARHAPKLLRTVRDKTHASSEDHEEPQEKQAIGLSKMEEEDLYAEPKSSDDEPPAPSPPVSQPSKPTPRTRKPLNVDAGQSRKPQRKSKRPTLRAPPPGSYQKSQAEKAKRGFSDDKENIPSSQSLGESQHNPFGFDEMELEQRVPKRPKITFGGKSRSAPTINIHSTIARNGTSNKAPREYGKAYNKKAVENVEVLADDELEDLLRTDKESSPGPDLRVVGFKRKRTHPEENGFKQPLLNEKELDDLDEALGIDPVDTKSQLEDNTTGLPLLSEQELEDLYGTAKFNPVQTRSTESPQRSTPTSLLTQTNESNPDLTWDSSIPGSGAPQEALENFHSYVQKLPKEAQEGSTCAICKVPVRSEKYWDFWLGKDKTVKNQNLFCRQHRTSTALDEYKRKSYPSIDWTALPQRIEAHRVELLKILSNDQASGYRDRYELIALTGKAATVPSRRSDLPEQVREKLDSYALDDEAIFPGYYGPHGRRVITESVMKMFKNEIKNCTDLVVQGSGPATFIQAVLVPETAVLLIMEDCEVHREEAEKIRERTYDMGMLLNEEIEDELEVHSDDENEYGGR